jgi:hypothetical protein
MFHLQDTAFDEKQPPFQVLGLPIFVQSFASIQLYQSRVLFKSHKLEREVFSMLSTQPHNSRQVSIAFNGAKFDTSTGRVNSATHLGIDMTQRCTKTGVTTISHPPSSVHQPCLMLLVVIV